MLHFELLYYKIALPGFMIADVMSGSHLRLKDETYLPPKKERRGRDERRRENRGRRKERPQTIQSHSIFEQGPADTVRKTGEGAELLSHLLDHTTASSSSSDFTHNQLSLL